MSITLPELPYRDDLAPNISATTLDFHYGKYYHAYATNLNKLLEGTDLMGEKLESIINKTANSASQTE